MIGFRRPSVNPRKQFLCLAFLNNSETQREANLVPEAVLEINAFTINLHGRVLFQTLKPENPILTHRLAKQLALSAIGSEILKSWDLMTAIRDNLANEIFVSPNPRLPTMIVSHPPLIRGLLFTAHGSHFDIAAFIMAVKTKFDWRFHDTSSGLNFLF